MTCLPTMPLLIIHQRPDFPKAAASSATTISVGPRKAKLDIMVNSVSPGNHSNVLPCTFLCPH